jgi:hypothetical protein
LDPVIRSTDVVLDDGADPGERPVSERIPEDQPELRHRLVDLRHPRTPLPLLGGGGVADPFAAVPVRRAFEELDQSLAGQGGDRIELPRAEQRSGEVRPLVEHRPHENREIL